MGQLCSHGQSKRYTKQPCPSFAGRLLSLGGKMVRSNPSPVHFKQTPSCLFLRCNSLRYENGSKNQLAIKREIDL